VQQLGQLAGGSRFARAVQTIMMQAGLPVSSSPALVEPSSSTSSSLMTLMICCPG
jgi:hypothetical protein